MHTATTGGSGATGGSGGGDNSRGANLLIINGDNGNRTISQHNLIDDIQLSEGKITTDSSTNRFLKKLFLIENA